MSTITKRKFIGGPFDGEVKGVLDCSRQVIFERLAPLPAIMLDGLPFVKPLLQHRITYRRGADGDFYYEGEE